MDKRRFGDNLVAELLSLGVRSGGVLLVHSSLKSLGPVPGGAETIIQGLLQSLGPDGTLLMPALTYETVRSPHLVFDLRATPSCVGIIPETFRLRPGTRRSLHPTHSVCAVGPLADELLAPHARDSTPCGPNSPFHRLPEFGGQILMLGCGLPPNTSMHAIEELVEPPYLLGSSITYTLTDENGNCTEKKYRTHNFNGWGQRYDRAGNLLTSPDYYVGKVREAESHLFEAHALKETVLAQLQNNPYYFVDQVTHVKSQP